MARKKVDFTVGEVFEEVVDIFRYLNYSISNIFIGSGGDEHDFYAMALGLEKSDLMTLINATGQKYISAEERVPTYVPRIEKKTDWIDFFEQRNNRKPNFTFQQIKKSFPTLISDIEEVYEYAVNGNAPKEPVDSRDGVVVLDCLLTMASFINSYALKNWFDNQDWGMNYTDDTKFLFLYETGNARTNLDSDGGLSLKELALLAGVDERTIRNAASAGAFEITKFGSSTLIDSAEARKWLNARPDFKPTKYRYEQIISGVYTATEFGNFVELKRQENELTTENVAKEIGVEVDVIVDLEKGIDRINLGHISKLQNLLKIEGNKLLSDYMEIFHPEEYGNLERLFQQTAVATRPKPDVTEKTLKLVK